MRLKSCRAWRSAVFVHRASGNAPREGLGHAPTDLRSGIDADAADGGALEQLPDVRRPCDLGNVNRRWIGLWHVVHGYRHCNTG